MRERIRLPIDLARPPTFNADPLKNVFTGGTPVMFRGRAVDIELAFFFQDALQSIATLSTLMMEIKTVTNGIVDTASSPVASKTLSSASFNVGLTKGQWDNGTDQHAKFQLLTVETGFNFTGVTNNEKNYALILCGTDNVGEKISFGSTPLLVVEDGCGLSGDPPPPGDPTYPTFSEVIALLTGYMPIVGPPGMQQIMTSQNGTWQRVKYVDNNDGEEKSIRVGPLN